MPVSSHSKACLCSTTLATCLVITLMPSTIWRIFRVLEWEDLSWASAITTWLTLVVSTLLSATDCLMLRKGNWGWGVLGWRKSFRRKSYLSGNGGVCNQAGRHLRWDSVLTKDWIIHRVTGIVVIPVTLPVIMDCRSSSRGGTMSRRTWRRRRQVKHISNQLVQIWSEEVPDGLLDRSNWCNRRMGWVGGSIRGHFINRLGNDLVEWMENLLLKCTVWRLNTSRELILVSGSQSRSQCLCDCLHCRLGENWE